MSRVEVFRNAHGFHTEHGGVNVNKSEHETYGPIGYVEGFHVAQEHRGAEGIALGMAVIREADTEGRTLFTHAREQLHRAYGRFGFQPVTGHPLDFLQGEQFLMRRPQ